MITLSLKKINNLKNNYNEMKTLLNNKLEKLELEQQIRFDNLKYALGQVGRLKMLTEVKSEIVGIITICNWINKKILQMLKKIAEIIG